MEYLNPKTGPQYLFDKSFNSAKSLIKNILEQRQGLHYKFSLSVCAFRGKKNQTSLLSHVCRHVLKKLFSSIYNLSLLLRVSQIRFWHLTTALIAITTPGGVEWWGWGCNPCQRRLAAQQMSREMAPNLQLKTYRIRTLNIYNKLSAAFSFLNACGFR